MNKDTTVGYGSNTAKSIRKNDFSVISGGLSETAASSRREFHYAYVTNTRLMGVLGMRICWRLPDNTHYRYQYQFFYFDAEEYGLDRYESGLSTSCRAQYDREPAAFRTIAASMFGGLGGRKREINENQALFLLRHFVSFNKSRGIPLPQPFEEYGSLLESELPITDEDRAKLRDLVCVKIRSPFEAANYFLMRSLGKDFEGARLLADDGVEPDVFPQLAGSTLLRNVSVADEKVTPQALKDAVLTCQSLAGGEDSHYMAVSRIRIKNLKVIGAEPVSCSPITPAEAAMILSRPEYVSDYRLSVPVDPIRMSTIPLFKKAVVSTYDDCTLFSVYRPDNDHVNKNVYRLDDDLIGAGYLTASGFFVVFSGSLTGIEYMERAIATSPLRPLLVNRGKYEFKENIMWEFISEGYEDLEDFLYEMDYFPI